jgi:hypothetical protein
LAGQSPAPGDNHRIIKRPVGLAFAGNAIAIAAVDTARKNPFSSEIPSI